MQTFDTDIENVTFSFVRVTYGKGDLWYHVSYSDVDKRITFRMKNDSSSSTWKVVDTKDAYLLNLESKFDECIKNFEQKLQSLPGRVDAINAAARMIK